MLSILLSILACVAASFFCSCLVRVQVSAPYVIAGSTREFFYLLNVKSMPFDCYRVVRGKPNHLLVNLISSKVRCVFSTSKLATKGPQRSVLTDNEANRTKVNIKRTTNSRLFRSGWFALYERFSKANRRCLQTEPGSWSDAD